MYIILIGYLFVVIMMSLGAGSITVGLFYFIFLAVLPTWGILALRRSVQRGKAARAADIAAREAARQAAHEGGAASDNPPSDKSAGA